LLEGGDGNGFVLQHDEFTKGFITMFRTCGHSLKQAQIKHQSANIKVLNGLDL
jgi:hypothetical protein